MMVRSFSAPLKIFFSTFCSPCAELSVEGCASVDLVVVEGAGIMIDSNTLDLAADRVAISLGDSIAVGVEHLAITFVLTTFALWVDLLVAYNLAS